MPTWLHSFWFCTVVAEWSRWESEPVAFDNMLTRVNYIPPPVAAMPGTLLPLHV